MGSVQGSQCTRGSRFTTKFFWVIVALVVLEEVTPFVPLFGAVAFVGLFAPGVLLWASRHCLAYVDRVYGTHYAHRLPPRAIASRSDTSTGD